MLFTPSDSEGEYQIGIKTCKQTLLTQILKSCAKALAVCIPSVGVSLWRWSPCWNSPVLLCKAVFFACSVGSPPITGCVCHGPFDFWLLCFQPARSDWFRSTSCHCPDLRRAHGGGRVRSWTCRRMSCSSPSLVFLPLFREFVSVFPSMFKHCFCSKVFYQLPSALRPLWALPLCFCLFSWRAHESQRPAANKLVALLRPRGGSPCFPWRGGCCPLPRRHRWERVAWWLLKGLVKCKYTWKVVSTFRALTLFPRLIPDHFSITLSSTFPLSTFFQHLLNFSLFPILHLFYVTFFKEHGNKCKLQTLCTLKCSRHCLMSLARNSALQATVPTWLKGIVLS